MSSLGRFSRNAPFGKPQNAVAPGGKRRIMGDDEDRAAAAAGALDKRFEHVQGRFMIEVSRRLIGKNAGGVGDHGTGNGRALPFAARKLARKVRQAMPETQGLKRRARLLERSLPPMRAGGNRIEAVKQAPDYDDHRKHVSNFLDCVKSRRMDTACTLANGSLCAKYAHLGNISARTGETLVYDELRNTFHNRQADAYLEPRYRKPWKFPKL